MENFTEEQKRIIINLVDEAMDAVYQDLEGRDLHRESMTALRYHNSQMTEIIKKLNGEQNGIK